MNVPRTLVEASRSLLLALLTPLILGAYSAAPGLALLPYVALVPWIVLYTDPRRPKVPLGWYVAAAWVTWMLLHPQTSRFGWFAPPVMAAVLFIGWLPFAPLIRRIHRTWRLPRTVTVPVVWVAVEWIRSTVTLSHFDVFGLGYSQAAYPALVQAADLAGVYGISFVVAAVNGLFADAYFHLRKERWRAAPALRRIAAPAAGVLILLAGVIAYGHVRARTVTWERGPSFALVQPNEHRSGSNLVAAHLAQMILTAREVPPGKADLILWPENAILDNLRRPGGPYLADLAWLAREKGARILVGAMGKPLDRPGRTTNSAFLVNSDSVIEGEYVKRILFPWSEYMPLDGLLGKISPGLQRGQRTLSRLGWGALPPGIAGDRDVLLHLPWRGKDLPFGVLICVENVYPPLPAEAARRGARFFVNITSEGRVAGSMQEHLLRVCMLRAVENRVSYVRLGNTGVSGIIDPLGRLKSLLRGHRGGTISDAGVLLDRVPISKSGVTVYARSRDAFAKGCTLLALVLYAGAWLRRSGRAAAASLALIAGIGLAGCAGPPAPGTDPEAAPPALERARGLVRAGRYGAALRPLAEACGSEAICGRALPLAAEAFRGARRDEDGADFFGAVAERYPGLAGEAKGYRGWFLEKTLELKAAEREYEEAVALDPSPKRYGMLGRLRMRLEDWDGAVEALRAGLALSPKDRDLRYVLARAYRLSGRPSEANDLLESVVRDDPAYGAAWVELGRLRLARKDEKGARREFQRGLMADPRSIEARYMLARLALRDGDLAKAERLLGEIHRIEASLGRGPREG